MASYTKEPEYYETQIVTLIEGFDPDQYGNVWYNVKFVDNAETFMWLAKEKPEEGKTYFGHVEPTSSGKRLRFKRDKEEDAPSSSKSEWKPKDERQITRNMAWKNLLQHFDVPSMLPDSQQWKEFWGLVDLHTEMLLPKSEVVQPKLPIEAAERPSLKESYERGKERRKVEHTMGVADQPDDQYEGDPNDIPFR